jgi:hypothetical protein
MTVINPIRLKDRVAIITGGGQGVELGVAYSRICPFADRYDARTLTKPAARSIIQVLISQVFIYCGVYSPIYIPNFPLANSR